MKTPISCSPSACQPCRRSQNQTWINQFRIETDCFLFWCECGLSGRRCLHLHWVTKRFSKYENDHNDPTAKYHRYIFWKNVVHPENLWEGALKLFWKPTVLQNHTYFSPICIQHVHVCVVIWKSSRESYCKKWFKFHTDVPNCFPQVQRNAATAETQIAFVWENYHGSKKKKKKSPKVGGKKISCEIPMNSFLLLQHGRDAGTHFIFGKRGYVPDLINSGRAALSVELPLEPRCTITQGGHLRSVWVWSCARVMNGCFFLFCCPSALLFGS